MYACGFARVVRASRQRRLLVKVNTKAGQSATTVPSSGRFTTIYFLKSLRYTQSGTESIDTHNALLATCTVPRKLILHPLEVCSSPP